MSYYVEIQSLHELLGDEGLLRLPSHLSKTFVLDDYRKQAINIAIDFIRQGKNVLIEGSPGTGKTALMFMILKKLSSHYKIGSILEGITSVRNDHLDEGIILFYDDLPKMNKNALLSIFKNNVKGLIVTARSEEISIIHRLYGINIYEHFETIKVPPLSNEKLKEMAIKYLEAEAIRVENKEAVNEIVKKARGLPVYIWQVVRELKIKRENLTLEYAKTIPTGMLDYIDNILWRILGGKEERYEAIITLLIMTDFVKFSMHQDLYNYIYMLAKERRIKRRVTVENITFDEVIGDISRYLARDGSTYSFRLPHDSWADVLKGKSNGPMAPEISRINIFLNKDVRRKLIIEAAKRAWHETVKKVDDPLRRETFKKNIIVNLGKNTLNLIIENKSLIKTVSRTSKEFVPRTDKTLQLDKLLNLLKNVLSKNKIVDTKTIAEKMNISLKELEEILFFSPYHKESQRTGYIYQKNFFSKALKEAKKIIRKKGKIKIEELSKQVGVFPEDLKENLKNQYVIQDDMIYTIEEFTKNKIIALALFAIQLALIVDLITLIEFPYLAYGFIGIFNFVSVTIIYFVLFYSLLLGLVYIKLGLKKDMEHYQIQLERKRIKELIKKVLVLLLIVIPIIGWLLVLNYFFGEDTRKRYRRKSKEFTK